jgi:hypothetical protein
MPEYAPRQSTAQGAKMGLRAKKGVAKKIYRWHGGGL